MSKLVEILLNAGALTRAHADAARQQQVVFGDRIGTNLMACGFVREHLVAQALGALHQVPYAAGNDATTRPAVTRGLHRNLALALKAVPARVDEHTAHVFVTDPRDTRALAQLEQHLQRRVQPVVVCEARMWSLLHKFYLGRKGHRALVLDDEVITPRHKLRPRSETRPLSTFSREGEPIAYDDPTTPLMLPTSVPAVPHVDATAFKNTDDDALFLEELVPVEEAPVVQGVLLPPPRDTSPLSFDDAKSLLANAQDRDQIALIVLRSCLSVFKRAVLLTVENDRALGWDAVGAGLDDVDVKQIWLPLMHASIFKLVNETKAHFLGPIPKEKTNILFLKLTGGQIPKSAFVVPVVVRGKVVNLLYCDNGKGEQVATDIGEMLVVAQHINRSYEALLRR